MFFENGTLVRNQNRSDDPGRYGDSCFDSSAFGLSWFRIKKNVHPLIDENQFFLDTGQSIRHPFSIWPETSQDQELPLFLYVRELGQFDRCHRMRELVQKNGWRTSNGKTITAAYYAELNEMKWLRCLCQFVQALFFYFPFYWNDGKFKKGEWPIGNNYARTDGFLQWKLIAHLTPFPFNRLVPKKLLRKKIAGYYEPEIVAGVNVDTTREVLKVLSE